MSAVSDVAVPRPGVNEVEVAAKVGRILVQPSFGRLSGGLGPEARFTGYFSGPA